LLFDIWFFYSVKPSISPTKCWNGTKITAIYFFFMAKFEKNRSCCDVYPGRLNLSHPLISFRMVQCKCKKCKRLDCWRRWLILTSISLQSVEISPVEKPSQDHQVYHYGKVCRQPATLYSWQPCMYNNMHVRINVPVQCMWNYTYILQVWCTVRLKKHIFKPWGVKKKE